MARAFSQTQPYDHQPDEPQAEWQALRGELVALLDQVESQVARTHRRDPAHQGLAQRMRALREQVGVDQDDRHREALRSVQRAVDRFSQADEQTYETASPQPRPAYPPNPRDSLQSAIQQIRSRQAELGAQRRVPEPPRFDELTSAVGGISARLERLEGELKALSRSQSGNVKEIADQVAQLSHVVELLAGAVGETGQVKRLESQIAGLAQLVAEERQVDLSALTQRLDDVAATVGRLADLQARDPGPVELPVAVSDGLSTIESGIRNIYDRIDAIERHASLSPEALDRLTDEVARVTEALARPGAPEGLFEAIDALAQRIAGIESRHSDIGGLRDDVLDLRTAIVQAMEPRFAALELQLEALTDRVGERPEDVSIGKLEAQVRQLVARMDQTGEQLTGLARMQGQEPPPDFDQLADLVAIRTSQAMAQQGAAATSELSEDDLAAIENRVSRIVRAATAREQGSDDFAGVRDNIREVNERLARLEASLTERLQESGSVSPAVAASVPVRMAPAAPVAGEDESTPAPVPPAPELRTEVQTVRDRMPANPGAEAPLTDKPFPPPQPLPANLEGRVGPRHPGLAAEPVSPADPPAFDPEAVARPPRPVSSFEAPEPAFPPAVPIVVTGSPEEAEVAGSEPARASSFIAAARRAAQRQQRQPEDQTQSLIARALSNAQSRKAAAQAPHPVPPRKQRQRRLAGDKPVASQRQPEPSSAAVVSIDSIGDQSAQPSIAEEKPPSFLARHSKVILLAASVLALSLLTLNLIGQRLAGDRTPAAPPAATQGGGDAPSPLSGQPTESISELPKAPRVIELVDSLATASIDPAAARRFEPAASVMPAAFAATAKAPAAAVTPVAAVELPTPAAALADPPPAAASPVKVELPPESLGPEPLRRAAADGDPRAQFEVAAIYTEGRAVPEDLEAAAVWYERAAAQGFAPAQYRLGNLYENGQGVAKDLEQARLWYQRAAEAGNRMSMHNLAALHAGGALGKQQFDTAAEWFEQAAQRGLKDSQFNLGMLHARGLGVPQDLEISYKWFAIAALHGDADAGKARDDIARSLAADAVARLDAEVEAWRPQPIELAANFAPIGTWSAQFDPGATIATQEVVRSVQKALAQLGYDIGTPDGIAGPKTAEAIRAFEAATGMSQSGAINPRLLAVLGSQPV